MCLAESGTKMVLFVFSSSQVRGRQWRGINFDDWSGLSNATENNNYTPALLERSSAHGCFYWPLYPGRKKLLVLDARSSTPVFSTMGVPSYAWGMFSVAYVEAAGEQGRVASVTVCERENKYYLRYDILQGDNGNGDQREPQVIIHLPLQYCCYRIIGVAGGYLLLEGTPQRTKMPRPDMACFSLDLRTLQLEWFCGSQDSFYVIPCLYAGWPSYLWQPTV
jgi:hypothetical protein